MLLGKIGFYALILSLFFTIVISNSYDTSELFESYNILLTAYN